MNKFNCCKKFARDAIQIEFTDAKALRCDNFIQVTDFKQASCSRQLFTFAINMVECNSVSPPKPIKRDFRSVLHIFATVGPSRLKSAMQVAKASTVLNAARHTQVPGLLKSILQDST
jgi:hypothetical protein